MEAKSCCGSVGARHKKGCPEASQVAKSVENAPNQAVAAPGPMETAAPAPVVEKENELEALKQQVAELNRQRTEDQRTLQMLREVADKGRVFNWEAKQSKSGKPQTVNLSMLGDAVVVGWRTVKDELILDNRTGRTVGEAQEYELLLLNPDGSTVGRVVNGYKNFSEIRYEKRIQCNVLGKSESYDGKIEYEVELPDNRRVKLSSRFIN